MFKCCEVMSFAYIRQLYYNYVTFNFVSYVKVYLLPDKTKKSKKKTHVKKKTLDPIFNETMKVCLQKVYGMCPGFWGIASAAPILYLTHW